MNRTYSQGGATVGDNGSGCRAHTSALARLSCYYSVMLCIVQWCHSKSSICLSVCYKTKYKEASFNLAYPVNAVTEWHSLTSQLRPLPPLPGSTAAVPVSGRRLAGSCIVRLLSQACYPKEFLKCVVFYYQMSSKCHVVNTELTVTMKSIIYHVKHYRSRPT